MKNELKTLSLKAEFLDNLGYFQGDDEAPFYFDELARKGEIKLSDFKRGFHYYLDEIITYETDANNGYTTLTKLILKPAGYEKLLKKYPFFQDKVREQWNRLLNREIENLGGEI